MSKHQHFKRWGNVENCGSIAGSIPDIYNNGSILIVLYYFNPNGSISIPGIYNIPSKKLYRFLLFILH